MSLVLYGWLVAPLQMRDVLKCATTRCGALSVMMVGVLMMLMWLVDKLDSQDIVSI